MAGVSKSNHPVAIVRRYTQLTQEEFAQRLGITRGHLAKIETNQQELSDDVALRLWTLTGAVIPGDQHGAEQPNLLWSESSPCTVAEARSGKASSSSRRTEAEFEEEFEDGTDEFPLPPKIRTEEYTEAHWLKWSGKSEHISQTEVDKRLRDVVDWVAILLNAAGRKGCLSSVRAALGQSIRDTVANFGLEDDVTGVLERFMFAPDEEVDASRSDVAVINLVTGTLTTNEERAIDPHELEPGEVYFPDSLFALPFWAPHAKSDHIRDALHGRKITMNRSKPSKGADKGHS